jgi:hypothetical protein
VPPAAGTARDSFALCLFRQTSVAIVALAQVDRSQQLGPDVPSHITDPNRRRSEPAADAMTYVTAEEIASIEQELALYHSSHADRYGPMETCTQLTCVETKQGIAWLKTEITKGERT